MTVALVAGLLAAATAPSDAAGPIPSGVGSVPVSPIHAAAWFVHGADETSKHATFLVYFEGTPGWHAKTTRFRHSISDTTSRIQMVVGTTPVQVTYRADTRAVRILDREFVLDRDNVYLVSGIDGPAPVVKGAGIHDLAFASDDNPAVVLLQRDAAARNALVDGLPASGPKAPPKPQPPADLVALDRQGIDLFRAGGAENDRRAFELFRQAADRGYAPSQYRVGCSYEDGRGVGQDSRTANQWFLKAAEQGYMDAQYKLAHSYRVGRGITPDSVAALKWYTRAADQGDAEAQGVLAQLYASGQSAPRDPGRAFAWFLKAAESGVPPAQLEVARRYRDGDGVAPDTARAYQWLVILLADPDVSAARDRGPADEFVRSVESWLDEGSKARAVAAAHRFCRAYARRYVEKLAR